MTKIEESRQLSGTKPLGSSSINKDQPNSIQKNIKVPVGEGSSDIIQNPNIEIKDGIPLDKIENVMGNSTQEVDITNMFNILDSISSLYDNIDEYNEKIEKCKSEDNNKKLISELSKKINSAYNEINMKMKALYDEYQNAMSTEKIKNPISLEDKAAMYDLTSSEYLLLNPDLVASIDENGVIPKKTEVYNPSVGLARDIVKNTVEYFEDEIKNYEPGTPEYKEIEGDLNNAKKRYANLENIISEATSDISLHEKETVSPYEIYF